MNKIIKILLICIFITNCSFNKNSKFWSSSKQIEKEVKQNIKEIFEDDEVLNLELNPSLPIRLNSKLSSMNLIDNYTNNSGRINFDGNLKNISKFKFAKIENFYQYDPSILPHKKSIIFFDNKGSILKFDENSKLIWKKNFYTKSEKKSNPVLLFGNQGKTLIVVDNISKYYALNINSGELIWSKKNTSSFNSQIKIYKDKFYLIDSDNILRCFSIKDGSELWKIKTENSLIKSQKKLSMVIVKEKIYFNNSIGDISAVSISDGKLLWQFPTLSNFDAKNFFSLKTSDLVANNESLYFSNNKNNFYSIDLNSGTINWKQNINSDLRPTITDNYIFTVSLEGYFIVIKKDTGEIIRTNNIFKNLKKKKKFELKPVGFILGKNDIYLTTNNGKLLVIDVKNGTTETIIKIDNEKISRPFVLNHELYIIKDNSIIKLN